MLRSFLVVQVACLVLYFGDGETENLQINTSSLEVVRQAEPKICDAGGEGLLFPILDGEYRWPPFFRGLCYALGLIYCFLGVSMIAETFMSAIEAVTSRRKQVADKDGVIRTSFCWNDTVANLSLMALGSSAPEIFLSIIDLIRKKMYASDLGPATIVGSAAFNLLVIVAVCVICIPYPEQRIIEQTEVFCLTAIFSIIAYLWIAFILRIQSPDEVEWWEAVITLLFLPVLIWMSYRLDILGWPGLGLSCCASDDDGERASSNDEDSEAKREGFANPMTIPTSSESLGSEESMSRGGKALLKRPSIASFHIMAMANLSGQRNPSRISGVSGERSSKSSTFFTTWTTWTTWAAIRQMDSENTDGSQYCSPSNASSSKAKNNFQTINTLSGEQTDLTVQLLMDRQVMQEGVDQKVLTICRKGGAGRKVRVHYKVELLAERRVLPIPYTGAYAIDDGVTLTALEPPKIAKCLGYASVDLTDCELEKDFIVNRPKAPKSACKDFIVTLRGAELLPSEEGGDEKQKRIDNATKVKLGAIHSTQVDVMSEDDSGCLGFTSQAITVPGKAEDCTWPIIVVRKGGCKGTVSCIYHTEPFDAVKDYDYLDSNGLLIFGEGVTERLIALDIPEKNKYRGEYKFFLFLKASMNSCKFDPAEDGGEDCAILTITIGAREDGFNTLGRKIDNLFNMRQLQMATDEWKEQLMSMPYCNGSAEEQKEASLYDWCFHVVQLPWELIFRVVPPTAYCGGWACFCACLVIIGFLTGIIADFAELFGCIVGIGDMVTAITFVALGTSMPDLFASKVAAIEDPTADASIVNVTGSNAVNVFLGLGLPWTAATIYWALRDDLRSEWAVKYPDMAKLHKNGCVFVVPSGNLGFNVTVFSCFALLSLSVLVFRRKKLGCELGGPSIPKACTTFAFVSMWFAYVCLASWRYARWEEAPVSEAILVLGGAALVELLVASGVVASSHFVDWHAYFMEKSDYDQRKGAKRRRQSEEGRKSDHRRSLAYLAQVAGNTTVGDAARVTPTATKGSSMEFDQYDHGNGYKSEDWELSIDHPDEVHSVQTEVSVVTEVTVLGKRESNGHAAVEVVPLSSTTSFQSDEAMESECFQLVAGSMDKLVLEPVPSEANVHEQPPRRLMASSLLKGGQALADNPDASNSRSEKFGPKLVPNCSSYIRAYSCDVSV